MKSTALKTAKVLTNIFYVLFIIGCAILPIFAILFLFIPDKFTIEDSIKFSGVMKQILFFITLSLSFLCSFIGMKLMKGIKNLLKSFEKGEYFNHTNVTVLTQTTSRLKYFIIVYFFGGIFESIAKGEIALEIDLSSPILIMIFVTCLVYILTEIFKHGLKIQEEQNLTV